MAEPSLRTIVVDDSAVCRRVVAQAVGRVDSLELIGLHGTARAALEQIARKPVDLVTLDIIMPEVDGIEFLRRLQTVKPASGRMPAVVIISGLGRLAADSSADALALGAWDIIAKPAFDDAERNRRELVAALQRVLEALRGDQPVVDDIRTVEPSTATPGGPFDAICIGASTGGPKALARLLPELCRRVSVPIVIVNHIPVGFDGGLANSLTRAMGRSVVLASDDQPLADGMVVLAPADRHLHLVDRQGLRLRVKAGEPEQGCRPAVDVLYGSLLACPRRRFACTVLTGMGRDGARHLAALQRQGHLILAQDQASSTVWGMPGAAIATGTVHRIGDPQQLADYLLGSMEMAR